LPRCWSTSSATSSSSGAAVTVEAVDEQIDYASAHEPVADPAAIVQDLRLIGYMVRG